MLRTLAIGGLLMGLLAPVVLSGAPQKRTPMLVVPNPMTGARPPWVMLQTPGKVGCGAVKPIPVTWDQKVIPIPTHFEVTVRLVTEPK